MKPEGQEHRESLDSNVSDGYLIGCLFHTDGNGADHNALDSTEESNTSVGRFLQTAKKSRSRELDMVERRQSMVQRS
jgi:molybdenum cofactor biosynthesis enzyme MoaA